jgi:hypothetical protein
MEAAFHFNYNNPKLQGVQDFVHSHLVNHDAWQNLRFWERSFYGHYPLPPIAHACRCVAVCAVVRVSCRVSCVVLHSLSPHFFFFFFFFLWTKRQTR